MANTNPTPTKPMGRGWRGPEKRQWEAAGPSHHTLLQSTRCCPPSRCVRSRPAHSRFRCFIGSDRRAQLCSCLTRLQLLAWIPVEQLAGALLPGFAGRVQSSSKGPRSVGFAVACRTPVASLHSTQRNTMQTSVLRASSVRCAPSLQRTRLSSIKRAPLAIRAAAGEWVEGSACAHSARACQQLSNTRHSWFKRPAVANCSAVTCCRLLCSDRDPDLQHHHQQRQWQRCLPAHHSGRERAGGECWLG